MPDYFDIDASKLETALAYLKEKSFEDGIDEVLIIKNGTIIHAGDSTRKVHTSFGISF
ncbi:MAG: hypothetical protein AAF960_01175 [Bacteroidota bacterium]